MVTDGAVLFLSRDDVARVGALDFTSPPLTVTVRFNRDVAEWCSENNARPTVSEIVARPRLVLYEVTWRFAFASESKALLFKLRWL